MQHSSQKISKKIITIPNILSLFRLILAAVFAVIYWNADSRSDIYLALAVLVLSGLTDFADGKIARHFGMISELGKVLDPAADKLTQAVVALCLARNYSAMKLLFAVLLVKELCQGIYGAYAVKKAGHNDGAKWCGKITTFYMYAMMAVLLVFTGIPEEAATAAILVGVALLLWSFISYILTFRKMVLEAKADET